MFYEKTWKAAYVYSDADSRNSVTGIVNADNYKDLHDEMVTVSKSRVHVFTEKLRFCVLCGNNKTGSFQLWKSIKANDLSCPKLLGEGITQDIRMIPAN